MSKNNVRIIVIIAVIFVSFGSILTKLSQAPPLVIAAYRKGFATLIILPMFVLRKKDEIKNLNKKSILLCILSGIFLALHFVSWITALSYTSITSLTVLVNMHPIFVVIGAYFILKEEITRKTIFTVFLTLLGTIIISLGDSNIDSSMLYGDVLSIFGAFFVSGYMLIGRKVRKYISVTTYTFIVYLVCTIILFILAIINNDKLFGYSMREWLIFISLAVLCTLLGHSIYNWALKYLDSTFVSTSALGEPMFATIWAYFIFNEIPTIWNIIGGSIVIVGIYLFVKFKKEEGKTDKKLRLKKETL